MPNNNLYPPVSQLLPSVDLPIDITAINDFISNIFNNLYYKDLIAERIKLGDSGFYKFNLVSYKNISYEIPGTNGLALILNPDLTENCSNNSSFPFSFQYQLEIVKYVNGLKSSSFQSDPLAFFNLLLEIVDLSVAEVLQETIEAIISPETTLPPIQKI